MIDSDVMRALLRHHVRCFQCGTRAKVLGVAKAGRGFRLRIGCHGAEELRWVSLSTVEDGTFVEAFQDVLIDSPLDRHGRSDGGSGGIE